MDPARLALERLRGSQERAWRAGLYCLVRNYPLALAAASAGYPARLELRADRAIPHMGDRKT